MTLPRVFVARILLASTVTLLSMWLFWGSLFPHSPIGTMPLIPHLIYPPFVDLNILLDGCDMMRDGLDPLRSDHFYNYPLIWCQLYRLGLGSEYTQIAGLLLTVTFLISVVRSSWGTSAEALLTTTFCLLSPPVLIALNRGNSDLIIFLLLFLCSLLGSKPAATRIAAVLTALCGWLKLYPIFAVAALPAPQNKPWKPFLIASVLGVFLISLEWKNLPVISDKTPRPDHIAYGVSVPGLRMQKLGLISHRTRLLLDGASAAGLLFILSAGFHFGRRSRPLCTTPATESGNSSALSLSIAGAAIFVGTFFLGSNWYYRLIFLLWLIPGLPWKDPSPQARRFAICTALLILCFFWSYIGSFRWCFIMSHLFSIAVLGCVGFWLGNLPLPLFREAECLWLKYHPTTS